MIVSNRARLLLFLSALMTLIGLVNHKSFLVQFGATAIIWIGIEWIVFRYRADSLRQRLRVRRIVLDRQGEARLLWKGQPASVQIDIDCRPNLRYLPATWLMISDLVPIGVHGIDNGSNGTTIALRQAKSHSIKYPLETQTIGAVQFYGLRCIVEDHHGFFLAERFLPLHQTVRVLSPSPKLDTATTIRKPRNAMPPPGIHSISNAGVGSELLDIRDYVPGDPPKSIAWKVSARRGVLMTKQFESEVPVRCRMFVDMCPGTRLGYPGPCLAAPLVEVATTISNLLISHRDAVGVSVFDGNKVSITKPSASSRAHLQMMNLLATCIDQPIAPVRAPVDEFIGPTLDVVRTRYPEASLFAMRKSRGNVFPRRMRRRVRETLANVIASHYALDELAVGELAWNDTQASYWFQRFLTDHHVPYPGRHFGSDGSFLFDDSNKIAQLARLLSHATARSRDSQLFLIFAELCNADYDLSPLINAIKTSVARQHRVVVLAAWPHDLPSSLAPVSLEAMMTNEPNSQLGTMLEFKRRESAYGRLRTELSRLRVPVTIAGPGQAIPLIAAQLDLVRSRRTVA